MSKLNRRDFLKAVGITSGASALSACGLDDNQYKTPVENILPYVVRPEQVVPGTYTFFATTVTTGPHAASVTARHRDGRVTFLSANFQAPTAPSVSSASFFELQKHYSPDRIKAPKIDGADADWAAGLAKLGEAAKAAKAAGKKIVWFGGYRSGALASLIESFTEGNAIFWEPLGYEPDAKAAELLFGKRALPFYGFDKATYILSFGAPFLSGWGDADAASRYAKARNPNIDHTVARFALVAPFRDQTGVNADDWFACTPGAEVLVARALAKAVAEKNGATHLLPLIGDVSLDQAASASGLTPEALQGIVANLTSLKGLAVPGGATGSTDLAAATYLLNLAAGAAPERFHLGGYAGKISGQDALDALAADLDGGKVGLLLLDGANPVYALPADGNLAAALPKADLVASLSSHGDETAALAKLVLPAADTLEDWGDEQPVAGLRLLRQPAMTALYDAPSIGDLLLGAARAAGWTPAADGSVGPLDAATWKDALVAAWKASVWDQTGSFDAFWETSLIAGFTQTAAGDVAPAPTATGYTWGEGAVAGAGDFHVVVVPHSFRKDGRYGNQPWAQEVPDPLTGNVWGSWAEIHPKTAAAKGIKTNTLLEITGPGGTIQVPAYTLIPSVPENTVLVHFGAGHQETAGRYGKYGQNAVALFTSTKDAQGARSWQAFKGGVAAKGGEGDLVTAFSLYGTSDEGRYFGVAVAADKLAAVGDQPAEHRGELTGIHHLELDKRLQAKGVTDFYPEPDRPFYRWALTVDTNACNGCGVCSVACYAENNLAIVGRKKVKEGREMGWIRINRYWETNVDGKGTDDVRFVPMMCQQCGHAGCENVCPVLATYHNLEGLNAMVYNRCVGTRYCSNACPFSARRFNYHTYSWPEPFNLQLNPDVVVREMGVMEKCTFCVQRIRATKSAWKSTHTLTETVPHEVWEQVPACVEACPSQALTFGNLLDEASKVAVATKSPRSYQPLEEIRSLSAVTYLAKASFHVDPTAGHHGGGAHADAAGHGEHGAAPASGEGHGAPAAHASGEGHGAPEGSGHAAPAHAPSASGEAAHPATPAPDAATH